MKTRSEIVAELAGKGIVEEMVVKISHSNMCADLEDLAQMVYLVLLEYDEEKIQDLYTNNQIRYFLARVILNQFRSSNSPFHITIRKFREMSEEIDGKDWNNEN